MGFMNDIGGTEYDCGLGIEFGGVLQGTGMQLIEQIRGHVFAVDHRLGLHIQHMHLELRKVLG
ncbi:hypothetical protein D3C85_1403390 [compost metagenome]